MTLGITSLSSFSANAADRRLVLPLGLGRVRTVSYGT